MRANHLLCPGLRLHPLCSNHPCPLPPSQLLLPPLCSNPSFSAHHPSPLCCTIHTLWRAGAAASFSTHVVWGDLKSQITLHLYIVQNSFTYNLNDHKLDWTASGLQYSASTCQHAHMFCLLALVCVHVGSVCYSPCWQL